MNGRVLSCVFVAAASVTSLSAASPRPKPVKLAPNSSTSLRDNIKRGESVDLAWASKSSVACFPSIRNDHFDGKHVLYEFELPPKSILKLEAVPANKTTDVSLYAYSVGPTNSELPPNVNSVVSCEASFGTKSMSQPYNPGGSEAVEMNATTNPYKVIVGVAGAQKADAGAFTLKADLKTAAPPKQGTITSAQPIDAKPNGTASVTGSIDKGAEIDLTFAANSSVACFPATRFDHFDGKQVAYTFSLPKYTKATIELTPKSKTHDLSLYAYSMGTTNNYLPPGVPSVVSCEASYGTNKMSQPYNPGGAEKVELVAINNPYNAVIVVAGAQGLSSADFELKVTLGPR